MKHGDNASKRLRSPEFARCPYVDEPAYAVLMELKRTLEEEREKMIERAEMDALCNGTGTVKVKEQK